MERNNSVIKYLVTKNFGTQKSNDQIFDYYLYFLTQKFGYQFLNCQNCKTSKFSYQIFIYFI